MQGSKNKQYDHMGHVFQLRKYCQLEPENCRSDTNWCIFIPRTCDDSHCLSNAL